MKAYFLIISGIAAALAAMSCSQIKKENVIVPGTTIPHDDFEYAVVDYRKTSELKLKDETITANGVFYIVTFNVKNNALRVDHTWDNQIAYLIADDSSTYENNVELQKKLNDTLPFGFKEAYVTPNQSEETTQLVFELPATAERPYLKVRGRILLIDFLDGSKFEKTKVKLF